MIEALEGRRFSVPHNGDHPMSFKERFTEEKQQLLAVTPTLMGSAMAFAESSGLGTLIELLASAKTYIGGLKAYPRKRAVFSDLAGMPCASSAAIIRMICHAKSA